MQLAHVLDCFERLLLCSSISNEDGVYWRYNERVFAGYLTQFSSFKFTSENTSKHVQNWNRLPEEVVALLFLEILKPRLGGGACTRGSPNMVA